MNRHNSFAYLWIFRLLFALSGLVLFFGVTGMARLSHFQKLIAVLAFIFSGYAASFKRISHLPNVTRQKRQITGWIFLFFIVYLWLLLDFTLADESLGRNFFRVFEWNRKAYSAFFTQNTNLIPLATIRLFVRAYKHGFLSLIPVVENLAGNLFAFMPFAFFLPCLIAGCRRRRNVVAVVSAFAVGIEVLQFLLMTGSPDIDDVLLNVAGAWICSTVLQNRKLARGLSKLTFGVWNRIESKD